MGMIKQFVFVVLCLISFFNVLILQVISQLNDLLGTSNRTVQIALATVILKYIFILCLFLCIAQA